MSTNQGIGEIEPAASVPRPSSVSEDEESHDAICPQSPIQEKALHDPAISSTSLDLDNYYDIMVMGMTGMGKSTTADKIIIASKLPGLPAAEGMGDDGQQDPDKVVAKPTGQHGPGWSAVAADVTGEHLGGKCLGGESDSKVAEHTIQQAPGEVLTEQQSNREGSAGLVEQDEDEVIVKKKGVKMHNLTFWTASSLPKDLKEPVINYLKNLHFYRQLDNPHLEVNDSRRKQEVNPMTLSCQLVSNEETRMRVLDVPGFFGVQGSKHARQPVFSFEQDFHNCTQTHLSIMRNILRIQATMKMTFRRILYFLPVRGPLEQQTEVLRQDLLLMAQYFGPPIFECMVLIATVRRRLSIAGALSAEELEETRFIFKEALGNILASHPTYRIPLNPPIVFISLRDTGESIVENIKAAEVHKEYLELTFDPGICAQCACTIRWLEKEKVECIPVGRDESALVPYDDSLCHPIFFPRDCHLRDIEEGDGEAAVVLSLSREGRKEEVCHNCGRLPGTEGCWKVRTKYRIETENGKAVEVEVDHTNQIEEHRGLKQVSPEDQEEGAQGGRDGRASRQGRQLGDGQRDGVQVREGRKAGRKAGHEGDGGQRGGVQGRKAGSRAGHEGDGAAGRHEGGTGTQPCNPQQIPVNVEMKDEEVACSPRVKTAEDDGESSSAMVVSKPSMSRIRPYDPGYDQPEDQFLQQAFGNMKGT